MSRKPWEVPIQYNDDRFDETSLARGWNPRLSEEDERDARDVEELLNRGPREAHEYECKDVTPIDYSKGPHDDEFGIDDHDFDAPDEHPVPYGNGPHDDEFGEDDED